MKKILIIEDNIKLKKYVSEYLKGYGYTVCTLDDLSNVADDVGDIKPDLILLDINLPAFDGFYFLQIIRRKYNIPIIIVSARNEESEQIRGMEMGADDYVTKPFSIGVLMAKINAFLRRTSKQENKNIQVNNLTLVCEGMQLKSKENTIDLSKNEYKLMKIFMENYNKVVKREDLLDELWDEETFVDDNTLTVNITRLKKKLSASDLDCEIITKRGIGYVFK